MWVLLLILALLVGGAIAYAADQGELRTTQPSQVRARRSIQYRTQDGGADYGFSIEQQHDGSFRPYITNQPSYRGRSTDLHATHRHVDESGRAYVCWSTPLESPHEALQVSAAWADATQEYIKAGRRF
jgi:hypothetical protein